MNKAVKFLCVSMLACFTLTMAANAQQNWRSQTALVLCDVLVLNQETSEKVVSVYGEVSQKLREQRQNSGTNFQDMSDEERTKFFEKMQKDTADALKKGLKDVLPEKEIDVILAVLAKRVRTPVAELRALRALELKDEQRKKIQPLAVELSKLMVPSGFRFFGAQMDEAEREKAEKAFAEGKIAFVGKVTAILSDDQNKAWKEKTAETQKEIDEMMAQRRSRQQ